MAKLVDALDLGSSTARCEGSSPFLRTKKDSNNQVTVFFIYTLSYFKAVSRVMEKSLTRLVLQSPIFMRKSPLASSHKILLVVT